MTLEIHLHANPFENQANVGLQVDYGRLFVNSHDIQFGGNGTRIDLVEDAGQNNLFEFYRFTAVVKKEIHTLALIYQPIFLESVDVVRSTLVIDERNISEGTPIDMSYNSYTRLSYWYLLPIQASNCGSVVTTDTKRLYRSNHHRWTEKSYSWRHRSSSTHPPQPALSHCWN